MVCCVLGKVFRGVKWLRICFSDKWLFVFILRGHVKVAGMNKRLEGNKVNEKKGGLSTLRQRGGYERFGLRNLLCLTNGITHYMTRELCRVLSH